MQTDIAFNPAAADAARRAKALPAPTQHRSAYDESPRGRGPLDPTFQERPLAGLDPVKRDLEIREQRQQRESAAVASAVTENAGMLAHRLAVPTELVTRLLKAESEISVLEMFLDSLTRRVAALEAKQ